MPWGDGDDIKIAKYLGASPLQANLLTDIGGQMDRVESKGEAAIGVATGYLAVLDQIDLAIGAYLTDKAGARARTIVDGEDVDPIEWIDGEPLRTLCDQGRRYSSLVAHWLQLRIYSDCWSHMLMGDTGATRRV